MMNAGKYAAPADSATLMMLHSDTDKYKAGFTRSPFRGGQHEGHVAFGEKVKTMAKQRSQVLNDCQMLEQLTKSLEERGLSGKWMIPRIERERLETELQIDSEKLLRLFTKVAQDLAMPSISVFHVGAAALGESGNVYIGPNVEVCSGTYASNLCGFHYVLHAEQATILCAFSNGESRLQSLYVSHAPCGMCRQFMTELDDHRNLCVWTPQLPSHTKLGHLLPHSFGPADLGKSTTLLDHDRQPNPIELPQDAEARQVDSFLAEMVERAAQRAHAPYTESYAGAVLLLKDGTYCCGSSVESAAFNPSVSPLQVALIVLFSRGRAVEDVEMACLAEDPSAPITYKGSDSMLLTAVAPSARMWLIPLVCKTQQCT